MKNDNHTPGGEPPRRYSVIQFSPFKNAPTRWSLIYDLNQGAFVRPANVVDPECFVDRIEHGVGTSYDMLRDLLREDLRRLAALRSLGSAAELLSAFHGALGTLNEYVLPHPLLLGDHEKSAMLEGSDFERGTGDLLPLPDAPENVKTLMRMLPERLQKELRAAPELRKPSVWNDVAARFNEWLKGSALAEILPERPNGGAVPDLAQMMLFLDRSFGLVTPFTRLRQANMASLERLFGPDIFVAARAGGKAEKRRGEFAIRYRGMIEQLFMHYARCNRDTAIELADRWLLECVFPLPEKFLNRARQEAGHFRGFLRGAVRFAALDYLREIAPFLSLEASAPNGLQPQFSDPSATADTEAVIMSDYNFIHPIVMRKLVGCRPHVIDHLCDPESPLSQKELAEKSGIEEGTMRVFLSQRRRKMAQAIHEAAVDDCGKVPEILRERCNDFRRFYNWGNRLTARCQFCIPDLPPPRIKL